MILGRSLNKYIYVIIAINVKGAMDKHGSRFLIAIFSCLTSFDKGISM